MELTITAKVKISPNEEQKKLLLETLQAVKVGCNFVSEQVYQSKVLTRAKLINMTYETLRSHYSLRSQMSQSIAIAVIAKYKSAKSNDHNWSLVRFKKPEYDLVFNRDYSIRPNKIFSVNTLEGRVQIPYETKGMEHFFDGTWRFGTAKLVYKKQKYFLHIPMTKEIPDADLKEVKNILGVDVGLNFLAVTFNSQDTTTFFKGRHRKDKRGQYKRVRKSLQQKQTPSARRRLRAIGSRENRWMTDVNHQVSKALVEHAGKNSLIVLEELEGIRSATEKVRKRDRWYTVGWAFYQLRQMIEYKAKRNQSTVIAVDPAYTSQTCPKCGHTEKANRNKKKHIFHCKTCGYISNDDRIGAMNLHRKGMEYLVAVTTSA
ncbi:RNA-guided endonuclease InsQ/TnpB family protein [Shimazuella kribbensis]|uniref:RNA-guided endonuclease InsQ/TnpB family protein n=1 Tax=Shimazuella kribbensis TaxID=139808 RepID=UPI00041936E0|nr:RNA-guided endonuclease TnpB family protein [Shimazuella kribbensis]